MDNPEVNIRPGVIANIDLDNEGVEKALDKLNKETHHKYQNLGRQLKDGKIIDQAENKEILYVGVIIKEIKNRIDQARELAAKTVDLNSEDLKTYVTAEIEEVDAELLDKAIQEVFDQIELSQREDKISTGPLTPPPGYEQN